MGKGGSAPSPTRRTPNPTGTSSMKALSEHGQIVFEQRATPSNPSAKKDFNNHKVQYRKQ